MCVCVRVYVRFGGMCDSVCVVVGVGEYLPLRGRNRDAAVVVVVASGLLADKVLDREAVLRFPPERGRLQMDTSPLDAAAAEGGKRRADGTEKSLIRDYL